MHQTKTFQPFHYFASTLIHLNPKLINIRSFGTDGEPELIKAFKICFPKAIHLRCVNHLRQNIKDKLRLIGITQGDCKEFLNDIFGVQRREHFEVGLIYAEFEAIFSTALMRLKDKWNNLERSFIAQGSPPKFYDWFLKYKVSDITCVLPEVRKRAGMESTCHFTTNTSESMNNMIKQEVQWKENKLPLLIEHLKSIVARQRSKLDKAVIGRGEWNFIYPYDCLKVPDSEWFSMSQDAKEKHMKKVYNCPMKTPACPGTSKSSPLSVPVEEVNLHGISESTVSGIWKKAANILVSRSEQVLEVPWIDNRKTRLVKSSSSPLPHLLTHQTKNQLYCCDSNCVMFKSFHLCSHVIAVAEINGELELFLHSLRKQTPNLTTIATEGLPSGSGRKGGQDKRRKRVKEKVVSRSVRPCLEHPHDLVNAPTCSSNTCYEADSQPTTNGSHPSTSGMSVCLGNSHGQVTASLTIASIINSLPSMPPAAIAPFANTLPPMQCASSPAIGFPISSTSSTATGNNTKPFVLKFLSEQIKVCQSCRNNYEGTNDTLGLVVARAERRLIINQSTGQQFLGKESNSHYHARLSCLQNACLSFKSEDLVIAEDIKLCLSIYQKYYLLHFMNVNII